MGVGIVVTSGGLCGVIVALEQLWNARDMGSIPTLGIIFPNVIAPTTLVAETMDPVPGTRCMVVEPTQCMYT